MFDDEAKIEGLKEIRDCENAWANWYREFNRRMEDENLSSFIPASPKVKVEDLKKKYPRAAAYLKAEYAWYSNNYEISAIGKRARKRILDGEDYKIVMADMEKENKEFVNRHIWD